MPSINSLKQVDHIAQIAKQRSRELSSASINGYEVTTSTSVPIDVLMAYVGITPKTSAKTTVAKAKSAATEPMAMTDEAKAQYNRIKTLLKNQKHKISAKEIDGQFSKTEEQKQLREYYLAEEKSARAAQFTDKKAEQLNELEAVLDAEALGSIKRTKQLFEDAANGSTDAIINIEKELGIKISDVKKDGESVVCSVKSLKNDVGMVFEDVENVVYDDIHLLLNFSNAKWNKTSVEALSKSLESIINSLEDGGQKQLYMARKNKLIKSLSSQLERGSSDSIDAIKAQQEICKMENSLRDMKSGLTRKVTKLDKAQTKDFRFLDETLSLEVQYTEVVNLKNGTNVIKYYNHEGELVAVAERSGEFNKINPMEILSNPQNNTGIKLYNQNGFHELDFGYYEFENGGYVLKEGLYKGKPINNKRDSSVGRPNYLRIHLGEIINNLKHQQLLDKLANKETKHPIRVFLEDYFARHSSEIADLEQNGKSNLSYKDICTEFKEFLLGNPKTAEEIKEAIGKTDLVINFGKGKNGEIYFGVNGTTTEGLDSILTTIGERQNIYQGKCAENVLFAQAGENLRGKVVYDMNFFIKDGDLYVGQYPPCSTCYSEISSHQWKHPAYMANRSSMKIKEANNH